MNSDDPVAANHATQIQNAELADNSRVAPAAEEQLRLLLDAAIDLAVIGTDARGLINLFNRGAERMLGYASAELLGKPLTRIHDPEEIAEEFRRQGGDAGDPSAIFRVIRRGHDASAAARQPWRYVCKDGRRISVEVRFACHPSADGTPRGYLGTAVDVTSQQAMTQALDARQALQQSLFDALPAGVVVRDFDGMVIECNRAASEILGVPIDDLLGRSADELLWTPPGDQRRQSDRDEPSLLALRTGHPQRDAMIPMQRPDGEVGWLLVNSEPVFEAGRSAPRAAIAAFVDVTERQRMAHELRQLATTDRLTGLPNRAMLFERLQRVIRRATEDKSFRFGVLFIDFDRFKIVNDTLGHEVGDALLKSISQRLSNTLRRADTLTTGSARECWPHDAARLGGDEFVVLLEDIRSTADCGVVADRLLKVLAAPHLLGQHEVVSTASIGIVTSDLSCQTAEGVLRDADAAMYAAKQAGKARYVLFDVAMRELSENRLSMETDLRKAVEARQFFLDYQPIVSLETGKVESFEALLRWNRPSHGIIGPGDFIQVAEDTGLIVPIGDSVIEEACRQLAQWRTELGSAAPQSVAVNLSRVQLASPGLPELLRRVMQQYSIEPGSLHLEVTESTIMRDARTSARTLKHLRDMGVRIAMDDFGTGHSSLSCLHEFGFDVLKIDRSFVSNLSRGRDFAALVHAIVTLARNLGMTVVAEGIETSEQLMLLQSLDCEFGQGYLFSRPMTSAKVPGFKIRPTPLAGAA